MFVANDTIIMRINVELIPVVSITEDVAANN